MTAGSETIRGGTSHCSRHGESQEEQDGRQRKADRRCAQEPSHPVSSPFSTEGIIMEHLPRIM